MGLRWYALGAVVAIALAGCGGRSRTPAPRGKPAAPNAKAVSAAQAALPEWAPKNPSPEFLRAARVLRPLSVDVMKSEGRTDAENAARVTVATTTWPAAYEFFGTLSDEQIDRFLRTEQVMVPSEEPGKPPKAMKGSQLLVPVAQLTRKQRAALDGYLLAYRKSHQGQTAARADLVVRLYKMGAAKDLSNVAVGFDTAECGAGHIVSILFRVTTADHGTRGLGNGFAQI
jgi:hypothetical protein